MTLVNLLSGGCHHFAARGRASNPLPRRRCMNKPLLIESLESRLCPVLNLTAAGVSAGFRLSTFVADFASTFNVGPQGIAFPDSDHVLVTNAFGGVFLFPDSDGQSLFYNLRGSGYGGAFNATDLANVGGKIYMTQQTAGKLLQINNDGTPNRTVLDGGLPGALGMAPNPATGHLFVSAGVANEIYDVDPIAGTLTPFASGQFDGLTLSADGSRLYGAEYNVHHVYGFDTKTKSRVFDSDFIPGNPDGVAEGLGPQAGKLYVNCNNGTVVEVDIADPKQKPVIATNGSRGDFAHVDPKDGSVLLTQSDRVVRLRFPSGPAASLRIDALATVLAGRPLGFAITARDAYGAVATGYTGTVTFTSTDPYPGLLPSNYTFTPSDRGTHIFGAAFFTSGTQTLTAQDTANSFVTGSGAVAVVAAPANHFVIMAPAMAVAGTPFDVTVTALDPYNNTDTTYLGTVTFTSTDPDPGVLLPASYTFLAADNGRHAFTAGVTLITPGDQMLTATDTVTGITGTAIVTVTPVPVPPPSGGANKPWTPSIETATPLPRSMSPGRDVAPVDRFFALLLDRQDSDVILPQSKHVRQSEAARSMLDFFLLEDALPA